MIVFTAALQCAFRLAFAFLLANQALSALVLPAIMAEAGTLPLAHESRLDFPFLLAINTLLLVMSIWLFFGIRTRVVASIALVVYAGYVLLEGPSSGTGTLASLRNAALAFGLALPLICAGGGPFSLYRKGWSGLADL